MDINKFSITGTLKGIKDGDKVILTPLENRDLKPDTSIVKNGVFKFKGSVIEPVRYSVKVEDKRSRLTFFNENSKITIKGDCDSLEFAVLEGSQTENDSKIFNGRTNELYKKNNIEELSKEYLGIGINKDISKERTAEIALIFDKNKMEDEQLTLNFIKEFPKSHYSAILIERITSGKNSAAIEEILNLLDPSLSSVPRVVKIRERIEEMRKSEVTTKDFITDAHNLTYSVDKSYTGKDHKNVIYLSVLSNDNVCAITSEGKIIVLNPYGQKVADFNSNLTSKPSAIAIDKADNIIVLGTIVEKKTIESRGRSMQVETPTRVECIVLDSKGHKMRENKLDGIVTATGARVSENNLLVADTRGRLINIYDADSGEKKSSIGDLRTCCGILDFCVRNNNEILVANLGAFRVNGFDYAGNPTISFGQRGTGIDEFHGCCNPVSVAYLSNGGIVTVEKDPTRIKVYSKEGAKKIDGIDELVKGCAYIPMTVDTKDNVYLASKTDGIVKCFTTAHSPKSYHLGFGKSIITRSNLAKANANRNGKIYEEFAY